MAKSIMVPMVNKTMNGTDISYYQGDVDFKAMKAAGVEFVIIRAGYGTTIDKRFITYINEAIKAGMHIGVYWFIYATNNSISKNNANKCLEVIAPYATYIDCGVWADYEYDSDKKAGGNVSPAVRSAIVETFNQIIEKAGYEVGIYSNQDYIKSGKFTADLIAKYPLWFAKYSSTPGEYAKKGKNSLPYMVQFTSSGIGVAYGVSSKYIDLDNGYFSIKSTQSNTVAPVDKVTTTPEVIKAKDNPYIKPTRNIYYRKSSMMYGDDVKWLQWHLWRFGLFVDKNGIPDKKMIDGYFGEKSELALEEAQRRLNLKPDKIAGPKTRDKFEQV